LRAAASRQNPRDGDRTRWNKAAWRRYLAADAPSLVDLERVFAR
jgi:hypothetical protein